MGGDTGARRAVAFVDGQNLFHAARRCFGYRLPNFDLRRLSQAVGSSRGRNLEEVRFYGRAHVRREREGARRPGM